ncbi:MAG: DUF305 domain-containing protein [Nocardioides sp.]
MKGQGTARDRESVRQPSLTRSAWPSRPPPLAVVWALVALLALAATIAGLALARDQAGPVSRGVMDGGGSAGPADEQEFLLTMIAHHREAIDAAEELRRSDRAEMRDLGGGIVTAQTAEVRQMLAWLATWYPDADRRVDYRPEMRPLSDLEGDDLDEAFLVDMVGHHMMAVMMARHLLASDRARHQPVRDLARSIVTNQSEEIALMRRWLRDWFGRDPMMMPGPW